MERIDKILANKKFKTNLIKLRQLEEKRIYCRHDIDHLLDVARLAYIEDLEKGLGVDKELIYATALLHDLGRIYEYSKQMPHNEASVVMAKEILPDCGFSVEEIKYICQAIDEHRNSDERNDDGLCGLIYRADKKSRNCFNCNAYDSCNWSYEKKNHTITD